MKIVTAQLDVINWIFCGDASSVEASLDTVKLLLNSVVSTKGTKFTTANIKDFSMPLF